MSAGKLGDTIDDGSAAPCPSKKRRGPHHYGDVVPEAGSQHVVD